MERPTIRLKTLFPWHSVFGVDATVLVAYSCTGYYLEYGRRTDAGDPVLLLE